MHTQRAKYHLGQVVRHRKHPFRGVVFDVDPEFSNTEEWYEAIPEDARPVKDQPFYHLLAENDQPNRPFASTAVHALLYLLQHRTYRQHPLQSQHQA